MTKKRPRVSAGLPVYNGERYLAEALDSLLSQTYRDLEIVISDNGSSDGTEEICQAYARRDPRVRYFRAERNQGAAWNFNRVFELSKGEFFKWSAVDDICAPTFIERCVEVLEQDPSVICCHAKTKKIDEFGKVLDHLPDPTDGGIALGPGRRPDASSPHAHRRFLDVLLSIGWSARSYAVIRASALRKTGLIKPYYGCEKVLMAELSLLGRFYDVPEVLFFQRIHPGASTALQSSKKRQEFLDPGAGTRAASRRIKLLDGYVGAVRGSSIDTWEKFLCFVWVGRYIFQVRKWKRIFLGA